MLEGIDLSDYRILIVTFLILFLIVFMRYLFLSGAYHWLFFVQFREKFKKRMLFQQRLKRKQTRRELILSLYSALIFSATGLGLLLLWQNGLTQIYTDLGDYPLWYLPLSIVLFLILHDTYYYWLHKWMHASRWLRPYHMEHHKSVDTSVFTSFSFHPVESFLQAIIVPVLVMLVPMHPIALLTTLLIMTLSAIINHGGVEIYPATKKNAKGLDHFIIGATHHDRHHRNAKKNFGLYFTFWDRLMKTEK
ncbi:MAG: sterol desaturase family protein [Bacteroidota bacterium]